MSLTRKSTVINCSKNECGKLIGRIYDDGYIYDRDLKNSLVYKVTNDRDYGVEFPHILYIGLAYPTIKLFDGPAPKIISTYGYTDTINPDTGLYECGYVSASTDVYLKYKDLVICYSFMRAQSYLGTDEYMITAIYRIDASKQQFRQLYLNNTRGIDIKEFSDLHDDLKRIFIR